MERNYSMSDEIDDANDEVQRRLEATLSNVDTEVPDNDTGRCIWCEEVIGGKARWCSPLCRDEHTKYANKI